MPRLMVRCPVTKQFISTGKHMDEATFENTPPLTGNHLVGCPFCHGVHFWSHEDVVLEHTLSMQPIEAERKPRSSDPSWRETRYDAS